MNLYNLMFLVLIGGAAALGFIYLDGPEAVQEYLDGETNSSQRTVNLEEPMPQASNPFPVSPTTSITNEVFNTGDCGNDTSTLFHAVARLTQDAGLNDLKQLMFNTAVKESYRKACRQASGELIDMAAFCKATSEVSPAGEFEPFVISPEYREEFTYYCVAAAEGLASQGAQATSGTPTTTVQGSQCSQLMLGCDAVVTNTGTWLNVRDAPTINGAIVGRLEDGMTVLIVGDRVEGDGYRWWQIESAGPAGWAAEGDKDGTAWLIPSVGPSDAQGSVSYGPSLADTANEPSYCQELAETRTELEAEDLWEYVKSQLEYSPNGQFLKECSAWGD